MLHVPSSHLIAHYLVTAVTPSPTPSGTASPLPSPTSTSVPIDPSKVQAGVLGLATLFLALLALFLAAPLVIVAAISFNGSARMTFPPGACLCTNVPLCLIAKASSPVTMAGTY